MVGMNGLGLKNKHFETPVSYSTQKFKTTYGFGVAKCPEFSILFVVVLAPNGASLNLTPHLKSSQ